VSDTAIAEAVCAWNALRLTAIRLHGERNARQCANEEPFDEVGPSRVVGVPCWKPIYFAGREDDAHVLPVIDWCDNCRERQKLHDELRATCKARGLAMRVLQRLCAKRGKP